jgi:hypothetical protein
MAEDKKEKKEEKAEHKKKHAGHGIHETHIMHHDDGSHTVTQHHEDGRKMSSAKADLDSVHDHLEDTVGTPNPGEAEANAGQSGVAEAQTPASVLSTQGQTPTGSANTTPPVNS